MEIGYYSKTGWASVDREILLGRPPVTKLMAGEDDPEPNYRARAYPAMDSTIFVVHGVLVLIINLHTEDDQVP